MYIVDGMDFNQIAEELRVSPQLLARWAKRGAGNDGVPWEEGRRIVQARIGSGAAEVHVEELKKEAKEVLNLLLERFREKKSRASFSDFPQIAKFLLELENLDKEKIRFMKTFVREAARIIAKHVKDPRTLMLISTEMDALVERLAKELITLDKWLPRRS